jgi:hypothetical protein
MLWVAVVAVLPACFSLYALSASPPRARVTLLGCTVVRLQVRCIEHADKNPKEISKWIQSIQDLHKTKPLPQVCCPLCPPFAMCPVWHCPVAPPCGTALIL